MAIRALLRERPMLGWVVAGVFLLAAAVLAYRSFRGVGGDPYALARTTQDIVIKDRETGEEWTMKRGRVEQILWDRGDKLDPNVGIPNPKTGKPTGFPKSDWEATIERIRKEREDAVQAYGGRIPSG